MLNKFSRPPTQNCYTTNNSQAQLQRAFLVQMSLYRCTQTCSESLQYMVTRAEPVSGATSQDRLVRDDQNGSSYHGHRIDVLLTEQRLEKQHCTLGKRSQVGIEAQKEQSVCWVKRGHGCRKAWNKGKDDEGIRGRFTG